MSFRIEPERVSKAVLAAFGKMDHMRKARGRFLAQFVGRFYREGKTAATEDQKASPLNMLYTAVTTMVPNLVANDPRGKVRTDILPFREYAELLGLATNHLVRKIGLRHTLRRVITDAIFLAGFIKTGIAAGDQVLTIEGVDMEIGEPYAERVDPDDMILDPWAREWDEQSFIGNRFRADLEDLQTTGLYDPDELERMSREYDDPQKAGVARLSGKVPGEFHEVRRFVDLCEVYFPKEKVVVTLPYFKDGKADKFLRVAEYMGPETGPYHMLGFTPVPDNLLPVAPAGIWYDLHILGNRIARKLARQAERLKRVLAYQAEGEEDVQGIVDADDGEAVRVQDVNLVKQLEFGGAADDAYAWMEWVKKNFAEQANSLDLLSGVGANAPTLGQSEMLQANTSVRLGDMQNTVYDFTQGVFRDLAFYLHTDPLIELPLVRRAGGVETQVIYSPEQRQGTFFDYTFSIEPHSMARPDPNMAVRRKLEFATNVIPAAANAAMLMGPGFKIGPFLRSLAREVQLEDADEWLDDPAIQQWILMKVQAAMATGDPGKAASGPGMGMDLGAQAPPPVMFNPSQPVPSAMGPEGGISPSTEQAMAHQETSGELQAAGRPSAKSMAMARGF